MCLTVEATLMYKSSMIKYRAYLAQALALSLDSFLHMFSALSPPAKANILVIQLFADKMNHSVNTNTSVFIFDKRACS